MKYLFLKYNNYYNRRIKAPTSLSEYLSVGPDNCYNPTTDYNFNPGDYLNTEIIFNWTNTWFPDYVIVYSGLPSANRADSRWFITNTERTREGQWRFTLKRDIVADDYAQLSGNVYNVMRCTVPDTNPLIFNKEPFEYNQIKTKELQVYDETMCPWIVGYIPVSKSISGEIALTINEYDIDKSDINHDAWEYYQHVGYRALHGNVKVTDTRVPISYPNDFWTGGYTGTQAHQNRGTYWEAGGWMGTNYEGIRYTKNNYNAVVGASRQTWFDWPHIDNLVKGLHPEHSQDDIISDLRNFSGAKVLFKDGVYRINLYTSVTDYFDVGGVDDDTGKNGVNDVVTQYIKDIFLSKYSGDLKHIEKFAYKYSAVSYSLYMTKVADSRTIKYSIPSTSNKLIDAPYRMFCMPYPKATATAPTVKTNFAENYKEIIEKVYSDIISKTTTGTGTDTLYDIQILPFCPIKFNSTTWDNTTRIMNLFHDSGWRSGIDYAKISVMEGESESEVAGYIYFPKESSFTFTVDSIYDESLGRVKLNSQLSVTNKKVQNETEFIRLCSPNYSGVFEMSPAKNEGINSLNISCTYKPFNPFIQVTPDFAGLYGKDFSDNRGLICTGDFSLPIINSAWTQYELNNKTYQQAFNREITHLEVGQDIARQQAAWQAVAGGVQGTVAGAVAGGMAGRVYGAAAGAAVGGVTTTVGGVLDYRNLVKQQKEDISYAKDMFNFGLQNIKALPNSLAKTSSLNANSKYVPFIECYSATDEEKELLEQYMEYNGMTAGFCGPITTAGFVQANLVKYNGKLEAHEVNELNNELLKGVYFE